MEKALGPFPKWMAVHAHRDIRKYFSLKKPEELVEQTGMRVGWPTYAKDQESINNYDTFQTLSVRTTNKKVGFDIGSASAVYRFP